MGDGTRTSGDVASGVPVQVSPDGTFGNSPQTVDRYRKTTDLHCKFRDVCNGLPLLVFHSALDDSRGQNALAIEHIPGVIIRLLDFQLAIYAALAVEFPEGTEI